jgi:tetratricopeptide (TPR) repeat protein
LVPAYANLGRLLFAQGELELALPIQRRHLELAPQSTEACVQLGRTLLALGRTEEALAVCRKAIALDPGSGDARAMLAEATRARSRAVPLGPGQ